jgi:hypothetical protein
MELLAIVVQDDGATEGHEDCYAIFQQDKKSRRMGGIENFRKMSIKVLSSFSILMLRDI